MPSYPVPICYACARFSDDMTCVAFPDGIPLPIQLSEADHRLPYSGDNGIMFEQNPSAPVPDEPEF